MKVVFQPKFLEQKALYGFVFTCEHCAHFDENKNVCIHGFPNGMHRLEPYKKTPPPLEILFCKDFDMA